MRTINATLLSNQKALGGDPVRQVVIGTSPGVDVSSFLLSYDYEERAEAEGHLSIVLDNSAGTFNSLSGAYAEITEGAEVEVKRGLTVAGTDYTEELPTTWVEGWEYSWLGGQALFTLDCVDWLGRLDRWRAATEQSWAATSATTIFEWILTQVSLTREAGAMTAFSLDFVIRLRETGRGALVRLLRKMPEFAHAGIDKEVKWREIDGAEGSAYTFGWNADHPVLQGEGGSEAWQINSVTVNGPGATGTASDGTQISAVGTRKETIYDETLDTNGECTQRAQAELDLYEAEASGLGTLVVRPCHGLELYDVLTYSSPAWGGSNLVGRCVWFREEWNQDGRWHQVIGLGSVPDKDPGNQPARKKRRKGRRKRRRRRKARRTTPDWDDIEDRLELLLPVGSIVMWSGAEVPVNWQLCDGTNSTPDLRNRFIVGAGDAYAIADTGGADANDLSHTHDPGTLAADAAGGHQHSSGGSHQHSSAGGHNHGGTNTGGAHQHTAGSLGADSDAHTHNLGAAAAEADPGTGLPVKATPTLSDAHTHDVSGSVASGGGHVHTIDTAGAHTHNTTGGHTHDAIAAHAHTVSGASASAGSAAQENRPVYYALAYIMRME